MSILHAPISLRNVRNSDDIKSIFREEECLSSRFELTKPEAPSFADFVAETKHDTTGVDVRVLIRIRNNNDYRTVHKEAVDLVESREPATCYKGDVIRTIWIPMKSMVKIVLCAKNEAIYSRHNCLLGTLLSSTKLTKQSFKQCFAPVVDTKVLPDAEQSPSESSLDEEKRTCTIEEVLRQMQSLCAYLDTNRDIASI